MTHDVILLGVTGSQAYGMARPDSDIDKQGVFMVPTMEILGRFNKGELRSDTIQEHDPDVAMHELGKYVRLASEMNPTAFEVMWLPEYEIETRIGSILIKNREKFLSQNVRLRYGGYARSQVKRLLDRGRFDPGLKPSKHGRHVVRLCYQAEQILRTGELTVRLTPTQAVDCFAWGHLAESDPEKFAEEVMPLVESLDTIPSDLPERPDMEALHELLAFMRWAMWSPGEFQKFFPVSS